MGADRAYILYEEVRGQGQSIIAAYTNFNEGFNEYHRLITEKEYEQDVLYLAEYHGHESKIMSGPCPHHATYKKIGTIYCNLLRGHKGDHFNTESDTTWGKV